MRLHIELDDDLVGELDEIAGSRRRSAFIRDAIRRALDDARRMRHLQRARGSIAAEGHDWDGDPAAWVSAQRRSDRDRVG